MSTSLMRYFEMQNDFKTMNTSAAKMKVFNNVLSGKIRIVSASGHVVCSVDTQLVKSFNQRLKNSLLLLKLIERLERRRDVLIRARKRIIQIQIDSTIHGRCEETEHGALNYN